MSIMSQYRRHCQLSFNMIFRIFFNIIVATFKSNRVRFVSREYVGFSYIFGILKRTARPSTLACFGSHEKQGLFPFYFSSKLTNCV